MNYRTPSEAYQFLLSQLREARMTWVVFQVQEQVRLGKPITKSVAPVGGSDPGRSANQNIEEVTTARGKRQNLVGTEEYSDKERVEILLRAVDSAVVQTSLIESDVIEFFQKEVKELPTILFEPDEHDESQRLAINLPEPGRKESIDRLDLAIKSLLEEVKNDD